MENSIITEEQSAEVANKILSKILPTLTEKLNTEFYDGVKDYLHEHYENYKNEVEGKLIKQLADAYISDPNNHKYSEIRRIMFKEHKDEIFSAMQQWITQCNLETELMGMLGQGNYFNWQWKDGISKFILKHSDDFKDDGRINSNYLRVIQNLESEVAGLKSMIHELKGIEE